MSQHYNTQILAYNRVSGTCRIIKMSSIRYDILSVIQSKYNIASSASRSGPVPVPESFRNQGPRTRTAKNQSPTLKWGKIRAWRVRRYCSLTFYINLKPLIVKIGWELINLCHILWNSKIWCATFAISTIFLISQPVFRFGPRPVQTGPRTAIYSGPCSDEMEGPGPWSSQNRSWSGPVHRSYAVLRIGPLSTNCKDIITRLWGGCCFTKKSQ